VRHLNSPVFQALYLPELELSELYYPWSQVTKTPESGSASELEEAEEAQEEDDIQVEEEGDHQEDDYDHEDAEVHEEEEPTEHLDYEEDHEDEIEISPIGTTVVVEADANSDSDLDSEADSDFGAVRHADEEIAEDSNVEVKPYRYEISQAIYHLRKVDELWKDEPKSEEWEALWVDALRFCQANSKPFRTFLSIEMKDSTIFTEETAAIYTPLHFAAANGLTELTRRIIATDTADINAKAKFDYQPLHLTFRNDVKPKADLVKLLLENGADLNAKSETSDTPFMRMLYFCPDIEIAKIFIEHKVDIRAVDDAKMTCLHNYAYSGSDPAIVELLVDNGADISAEDYWGETPLHRLISRFNCPTELLEAFLKHGAEINKDNSNSQQPLYEASATDNIEAVKILLKNRADVHDDDSDGLTALHVAAIEGKDLIVKLLIEYEADQSRRDKQGRTPFYGACQRGHMSIVRYLAGLLKEDNLEILNQAASNGKTIFWKACAKGNLEVAQFLLEQFPTSISVDVPDKKFKRTELHAAAYHGQEELVALLLSHNANPAAEDKHGKTPLTLAYNNWAQGHVGALMSNKYTQVVLQLIDVDREAAVKDVGLLHVAATQGSMEVLNRLLHGYPKADPDARDEYGWTAVDHAKQCKHEEAARVLSERSAAVGLSPTAWKSTDARRIVVSEDGLELHQGEEVRAFSWSQRELFQGFASSTNLTFRTTHPL
jgi:ankyrin repeat protein